METRGGDSRPQQFDSIARHGTPVVAVFVGLFSTVTSYRSILLSNADESTLLVMKTGAGVENESSLSADEAGAIETAAKASDSSAIVSPEMSRLISVKRQEGRDYVNVALRGVTSAATRIRSKLRIVDGRFVEPGKYELLVGRGSQRQFMGLQLGSTLRLADTDWDIVGVFEAEGGAVESEVWADLPVLQSAYRLGNGVHSVRVKTGEDPSAAAFIQRLQENPTLGVTARPNGPPPVISAAFGEEVNLFGSAHDEGLPRGKELAVEWKLLKGPGTVSFTIPKSARTKAAFSARGLYELELSASDSEFTERTLLNVAIK